MPWRFHRVLNIIPGLLRLNLSKGGVSTSLGPRGADLNIGRQGVTTNAGLPGTGLSYRQKLGVAHGSGIGVGLFIAALAFAGWKYLGGTIHSLPHLPGVTHTIQTTTAAANTPVSDDDDAGGIPTVTKEHHASRHAKISAGADVIAAAKPASGLMYVHRNNSDLRPAPSTSSEAIKKLAKGDKVTLLALSDKWAKIDDAGTQGWVRASILKDTPPGAKSSKHKKADKDDGDGN